MSPLLQITHSPCQECRNYEPIIFKLTIYNNDPFANFNAANGEQLALSTCQYPFRITDSFKDLRLHTKEFIVFFDNVLPSLIWESNGYSILGVNF